MVELFKIAERFLSVSDNEQTLISFIHDGSMETALTAVDDVALQATLDELQFINNAGNKRGAINRAATQLGIAFAAFSELSTLTFGRASNVKVWHTILEKRVITAMALVSCYACLGEWHNAFNVLSDSYDPKSIMANNGFGANFKIYAGVVLSPLNWLDSFRGSNMPLVQTCSNFEVFRSGIINIAPAANLEAWTMNNDKI